MSKAVVIGGAGFIGRRLVEMLAGNEPHPDWARFDHVHVVDLAPATIAEGEAPRVTTAKADVRSHDDLRRAFEGADTVFHLASVVDVGLKKSATIEPTNVGGARNVVAAAREAGVRALVYTSSEDVLLSEIPVRGGDETMPYPARPIHDYVRTKIEGERIVLGADDPSGLRTLAIRPVHVYGPRDPHAIVTSLRAFAKGSVPFLLGNGEALFDVVYVDNVVHAHLLAARALHEAPHRVAGRPYIVNEDHAVNYFEWLRPYAARKNVKMPRLRLGRRPTHALARAMGLVHRVTGLEVPFHSFHAHVIGEDFYFSSRRAKTELGYTPIVSVEDARRRTLEWLDHVALEG
ncbi:MAG: NAD-dependent epimerase/dehydratase family protein [Polyangiaceae bacterium]